MPDKLAAACIQNAATPSVAESLETPLRLFERAIGRSDRLVCLPEYFSGLKPRGGATRPVAYPESHAGICSGSAGGFA